MCCILVKIIDYSLECRLLAAAASLLVREEKRGRGKEIVLVTASNRNIKQPVAGGCEVGDRLWDERNDDVPDRSSPLLE